MKKAFLLFSFLLIGLLAIAQNPCPQVIPALQEWKGSKGTLHLPAQGSIIINPSDEMALASTAAILKNDLKELMGWEYTIITGKAKKDGIYLSLSEPDEQLGKEGYELSILNKASIQAPTAQGVFWGTRTLLQMLYRQDAKLAKGTTRDWPEFPNRGFMLDVGRKFFTLDYLKEQIKVLSFYKMNEFQIHLNDNGFPHSSIMIGARPMQPSDWRVNVSRGLPPRTAHIPRRNSPNFNVWGWSMA